MAFIEPMHRNKPNITYLLALWLAKHSLSLLQARDRKRAQVISIYCIDDAG